MSHLLCLQDSYTAQINPCLLMEPSSLFAGFEMSFPTNVAFHFSEVDTKMKY